MMSSSHFEQIREKRKSIWDRLSGYQSEERSLDTDRYFSKQKNDKYIDGSFEYAAPKATNGKCEDLDRKTKEAEDEYRCSIAFLWMYADSDLSSISEWDRALIQNNRKQIKSFEKKYPHLAAQETKILLEKTKLSSRNETMKEDQHTEKAKRNENDAYGNDTAVAAVKRTGGLSVDVIYSSKKQKTMSSEDLNVAIVDWSDLDGNIMPANWLLLEERLLNEMVSEKWCNDIISFDGAEWSRGVKLVKCGNEKSLEFLKTTIAKVGEMWPRAQLAVIPESRLPLRTFVNMWIPPPVPETRNVFELLGKQNEGFVIDDWQIISTTPCHNNNGITFRLAVDAKSLKKLKECHGHVRFGFGFIRIQTE